MDSYKNEDPAFVYSNAVRDIAHIASILEFDILVVTDPGVNERGRVEVSLLNHLAGANVVDLERDSREDHDLLDACQMSHIGTPKRKNTRTESPSHCSPSTIPEAFQDGRSSKFKTPSSTSRI
jgi:hypothetical protein